MSLEKRIDPKSNRPLKAFKKALPKGLNGIKDIKERSENICEVFHAAVLHHLKPKPE